MQKNKHTVIIVHIVKIAIYEFIWLQSIAQRF